LYGKAIELTGSYLTFPSVGPYRHGLRASEIGLLQRADVDAKQGRISIHRLKGSISGVYPMQPDVLKAIRSYLRTRADESPYLFLSNRNVPISRYTLHYLMQTYGAVAGLPMEKRKFHCLKHSIATHLLDAGADLAFVKDWLGTCQHPEHHDLCTAHHGNARQHGTEGVCASSGGMRPHSEAFPLRSLKRPAEGIREHKQVNILIQALIASRAKQ
jgi:Phage integrase family